MPERGSSGSRLNSEVSIDGQPVRIPEGVTVLAALYAAGRLITRRSLSGEARAPLCGMGSCYECRVLVNGAVKRSCLTLAQPGMEVTLMTELSGAQVEDAR